MTKPVWQEQILPTPDLHLAFYEAGNGPTILFLHGGPGDDHRYMRPLAEPLIDHFHCVLYDQRGSGRSRLDRLDETRLHINRFLEDIEALRTHLGQAHLTLVGHSWGASLALLYSVSYPEHVERVVLIGLGPINDEMSAVAAANLRKPLSKEERAKLAALSAQRRAALEMGDLQAHRDIHIEIVTTYSVRGWFYAPEAARRFCELYRSEYAHNPIAHRYVVESAKQMQSHLWEQLPRVKAPMLILYGYQDFEPITQAYLLQSRIPHAQVCLLNECGHVPWMEQAERFYQELGKFLL